VHILNTNPSMSLVFGFKISLWKNGFKDTLGEAADILFYFTTDFQLVSLKSMVENGIKYNPLKGFARKMV